MIFIPPQWIRDPITLPINGMNIYTTLNVDIQDIAERSLRETLSSVNADWGCAVVMEVKTGLLRNCQPDHVGNGRYQERTNHALADSAGTRFDVQGYIHADSASTLGLNIRERLIMVTLPPLLFRGLIICTIMLKGGYGRISAAQSIWYSSNVGWQKRDPKGIWRTGSEVFGRTQ